jgi:predicted CXXCH cytochrome family protein
MALDTTIRTEAGRAGLPGRSPVIALLALLTTVAALGWVVWKAAGARLFDGRGGLSARLRISADVPPNGRFPRDPYIGSAACAGCHPGEYALYTGSGHARTFRAAADRLLTDQLSGVSVQDPELPAVRWSFQKQRGEFTITRDADAKLQRFVVDYALGSGHHATTFVTVQRLDPPRILEHRLTHFTGDGSLGITPGQKRDGAKSGTTPVGCELLADESLKCFGCHATQLSGRDQSELDPTTMIPGVTCERCHGPARAHVEAASRGALPENLKLAGDSSRWEARRQLEFCGRCHRHPDRVPPEQLNPEDPHLARFQPIGLSQSRCYRGSNGRMTCLSCHDPHARSSPDRAGNERVCLGCHRSAPTGAGGEAPQSPALAASTCPVSPSSGCLPCHMPRVDSGQNILFTDHWIRVHPAAAKP